MLTPTKRNILKWVLWVTGLGTTLFLVGLLASWWLPKYFSSELDTALKESVRSASDSLYQINYEKVLLNIPLGNAEVNNVKFTIDSTVYQRRIRSNTAPNLRVTLEATTIRLSGVSLMRLFFFKALSVNDLLIDHPLVQVVYLPHSYNKSSTPASPYALISQTLRSVSIDKIRLENVNVTYLDHQDSLLNPRKSSLKSLYLDVSDFLLSEDSGKDSSRILYSSNLTFRAEGLELPSGDARYQFRMEELSLSTKDSTIQVKNIHYKPLLSKEEFSKKLGLATDRLDLKFKNIRATQVDMRRLLVDQELFARQLHVDAGTMDIFKDKRYRMVSFNKIGRYPHQLLLKSHFKLGFDQVYLKSIRVQYGELNENTNRRGVVFFDETYGKITNLTNDSAMIVKDPLCRLSVRTRFMNASKLNAYFTFNLAARNGDFGCEGSMKNFDMTRVSELTEALAQISVKSGKVSSLHFVLRANNTEATIKTQLLYDNLKVEVLKVEKETGDLKRRRFLSQLINNVLLNDHNPTANRPTRVGEAVLAREDDESFFNLIWRSISVSIKQITVGLRD